MTRAQIRIVAVTTAISLAGLLVLQGRWLWRGYRDARATYERRVDLLLAGVAERIDPGDELFNRIMAVVERPSSDDPAHSLAVRDALAGIREKIDPELDRAQLPRRYSVMLTRAATPAAYWTDRPSRDSTGARSIRLGRLCPPCDVRVGVAFDDVRPATFLAEIGGVLAVSVLLVCALIACVAVTVAGLHRMQRQHERQNAFVNNLAHEFRTPLFTISVAGKVLAHAPAVRDDRELSDEVARIGRAKERLAQHTERLLDLSALQSGRIPNVRESVDTHDVVRRVAADFAAVREAAGATLRLELDADNAMVLGDAPRLEQAIGNLLDNAFKYGAASPVVVVRTKREGGALLIEVEDNGAGIAPRYRADIFAPFFRITNGARHDVKGFGLGLSHVREVAAMHGGSIAVREAATGVGSVFVLTLPAPAGVSRS